ncbi:MAG TPA: HEAT repeat domain-containing protein [Longimicrobium sp.]
MTFPFLLRALLVLAGVFAAALAIVLGHGTWLYARRRRAAPRLRRGRAALRGVARGEAPGPAEMEILRALPWALRTRLLVELSRSLSGSSGAALNRLGRELGVVERAERMTRSLRWPRRLRGARILTGLGGSEAVMLPLFADRHPAVRAQAADWAAHHPSPRVVRALLECVADTKTAFGFAVQDSLLRLGMMAIGPMAEFLAERSGPAAASALELAAALPHAGLQGPALELCRDPHPPTRARALRLLAAVGGSETSAAARALLSDPEPEVRAAAAAALGRTGDWASAPEVARRLRDPSWEVRRAAGLALRALGGPGLLLLRRYRDDPDPFAADMARQTLDVSALDEGGGA